MRTHDAMLELMSLVTALSLLTPGCGDDGDPADRVDASGGLADAGIGDPDAAVVAPPCGRMLSSSLEAPLDAAANDDAVYIVDSPPFEDQLRVHRIQRDTGAVDLLATLDAPGGGFFVQIAADDLFVYLGAEIGLWRIPAAGGEPEQLTADRIDDLAQDATHLFWKTLHPGGGEEVSLQLERLAKAGGAAEVLYTYSPGDTTVSFNAQLTVDRTYLYWNDDAGDLRRMPRGGGEVELFADLAGARLNMTDLVHDDGAFYWATRDDVEGDAGHDFTALRGGTERTIARVEGGYVRPRLVVRDQTLFFSHTDADGSGLYRVSVEGGDPERLAGYIDAVVPTAEGLYVAEGIHALLLPPEGCPAAPSPARERFRVVSAGDLPAQP